MSDFSKLDSLHYDTDESFTPLTPSSGDLSKVPSFEDIKKRLADQQLTAAVQDLDLNDVQDFLVSTCKKAGAMMKAADPSVDSSLEKKNSSDRVTETDRAIEAIVKSCFQEKYPTFSFFGEETCKEGQKLGDEPTLVCDPIDGTLNFIHGFPNYAISLALCVCKRPVVSAIYNQSRGDLFTAIKGRGAFLTKWDGSITQLPIKGRPDSIDKLKSCLVALEWGSDRKTQNWHLRTHMVEQLLGSKGAMAHSIRSSGSAALDFCYVAAGWIDLFWEGGCWIWDVAGGWLIVEEAGGVVVGANPGEWNPTLEGRSYFAIRGAPSGQKELAKELWSLMGDRQFAF